MKLTILGSGTHMPSLKRNSAGYLLEINSDFYLIDIGSGIIKQILKAGADYKKISHIFITHRHIDHIADILPLFFNLSVLSQEKQIKNKVINLYGPKGFKKFIYDLIRVAFVSKKVYFDLRIKELGDEEIKLNGLKIEACKVRHQNVNAIAYKFKAGAKTLIFSGDLEYSKKFVKFAKNADALVLECSLPKSKAVPGHLVPEDCGKIAKESNVKKIILTHFYPPVEKINIKDIIKKSYPGKIILSKDLMKIKI